MRPLAETWTKTSPRNARRPAAASIERATINSSGDAPTLRET